MTTSFANINNRINDHDSESQNTQSMDKEPGLFKNIILNLAQISLGVSYIQLSPELSDLSTAFMQNETVQVENHINNTLSNLPSAQEQINYLTTTNKELRSISENLLQSQKELYDSYKDSASMCSKRLQEFEIKKQDLGQVYLDSKLEVENLKSINLFFNILEQIILNESKADLCKISKDNLKVCNDVSKYCTNYQIEYDEEVQELEDLLIYFKQYLDKI